MAEQATVNLDPNTMVQHFTADTQAILEQAGMPTAQAQALVVIVQQFVSIATQQINQQPFFQASANDVAIPFDEAMCARCIELFAFGVQHAAKRTYHQQLNTELASAMLQNLAQDVFLQAKQVVASTIGQENTPELQFPKEQLIGWMTQSADAALVYYVNEYEKQNGPIAGRTDFADEPEMAMAMQPPPQPMLDDEAPPVTADSLAAAPLPEPVSTRHASPVAQPTATAKATPRKTVTHEKWAALALFISTLPQAQQDEWLMLFDTDERNTLIYLMNPDHVIQHCHLAEVVAHLRSLQQTLWRQLSSPEFKEQKLQTQLMAALGALSPQRVSVLAHQQRPVLKRYLQVMSEAQRRGGSSGWLAKQPNLSPMMKEGLLAYLHQQTTG
jgi:hypothetical protein